MLSGALDVSSFNCYTKKSIELLHSSHWAIFISAYRTTSLHMCDVCFFLLVLLWAWPYRSVVMTEI